MNYFKRREVYMGFSTEEFQTVRRKLAENGIKYDYKVINRISGGFGGSRTVMSSEASNSFLNQYYVYVDKKDYEWAMQIVGGKIN